MVDRKVEQKAHTKAHYDRGTKELPPLNTGDRIKLQDYASKQWREDATVVKSVAPRSYSVTTDTGVTLCRNRRDLRLSYTSPSQQPSDTLAEDTAPMESSNVYSPAPDPSPDTSQSETVPGTPLAVRRSSRQVKAPSRLIENM